MVITNTVSLLLMKLFNDQEWTRKELFLHIDKFSDILTQCSRIKLTQNMKLKMINKALAHPPQNPILYLYYSVTWKKREKIQKS